MDPRAALVAAKLSGKMPVTVGIGRLDYTGRFQPFGQAEFEATVYQGPDGFWVAKVERAAVPYEHPSPRIITHVGMFMYDQWFIDELPTTRKSVMTDLQSATFTVEYPLPETL